MSKWRDGIKHEWEMELKAWQSLLAQATSPHDIAHAHTRMQQAKQKLAELNFNAWKQTEGYRTFWREWKKVYPKIAHHKEPAL